MREMAISSEISRIVFIGNGSVSTPYALAELRFDDDSWLWVERIAADRTVTRLVAGVDYTITGNGVTSSASVVTGGAAIPATEFLRVSRHTPLEQGVSLAANGEIPSATLERMADWRVMALLDEKRRQEDALKRSLRVPDGEVLLDDEAGLFELARAASRSGKYLGFDEAGEPRLKSAAEIMARADLEISADVAAAILAASEAEAAKNDAEFARSAAEMAAASIGDGTAVTNAESFRQNLDLGRDIFFNEGALLPFWKALMPLQTATPTAGTYVSAWGMGDSMGTGSGPAPYVLDALIARYGIGALVSGTLMNVSGLNGVRLNGTVGGSTALHPPGYDGFADFTYWLNGRYYRIPSGGTLTETPVEWTTVVGWSRIKFLYGIRSGGGTLTFDVRQNGVTISGGSKSANTGAGTAGSIGVLEITAADGLKNHGALSIVATGSVAESHYLGCVVYLEKGGIIPIQAGCGSQTYEGQNTVSAANWTTMRNAVGCTLTLSASKGETQAGITNHISKLATHLPTSSHILLGNTPTAAADFQDIADNQIYRKMAFANNLLFVNGHDFALSWAWINTNGMGGDLVHLSTDFNRLFGNFIGQRLHRIAPSSTQPNYSGDRLMTYNDWNLRTQVCDTKVWCPLTSDATESAAGTGWTINKAQGIHSLTWTTSAGGDSVKGIRSREYFPLSADDNLVVGFTLLENFASTSNVSVRLGFGVNDQPGVTIDRVGLYWEFGFDSSTTPWVRFIIYDTSGNTSTTDKHYLPLASGGTGYRTGGSTPNRWVIRYDGCGSAIKRLRCWVCTEKSGNTSLATEKPLLVCDTKLTLGSILAFYPPTSQPNICFQGVIQTSSPASGGSARLLSLWYDRNPDDATILRTR